MTHPVRSLYRSDSALLRVKVRPPRDVRHPASGDIIERKPGLYAEFGIAGPEQTYMNQLTGEMDSAAQIIGGLYDLDSIAEYKISQGEWTEEDRDMVKRRLDTLCQERPALVQRVDFVTPPAAKPWPTYDDLTDTKQIVTLAGDLGLLSATLAYERENLERTDLIAALEAAEGVHPDPEPDPEPVVAAPAKKGGVVEKSGYRIVV